MMLLLLLRSNAATAKAQHVFCHFAEAQPSALPARLVLVAGSRQVRMTLVTRRSLIHSFISDSFILSPSHQYATISPHLPHFFVFQPVYGIKPLVAALCSLPASLACNRHHTNDQCLLGERGAGVTEAMPQSESSF